MCEANYSSCMGFVLSHLSFFLSIPPFLPDFALELPEDSQLVFFLLLLELLLLVSLESV